MSDDYRVNLDVFSGPLDLLLYLIRRDELDIQDIPIAKLTEQYLDYVRLLEQIDPNSASEFLVMAATLAEIKSRALLPTPPLETLDEDMEDPRATLVRQLLEYKRFKDVAEDLRSAGDARARRHVRRPANLPQELQGLELEEAQVWDLLEAFGQVMTAIGQGPGRHEVHYEDTPVELHMAEIVAVLEQDGPTTFADLFDGELNRAEIIGRFLALLELVRSRRLRAEQDRNFGTIYLFLTEPGPDGADGEPAAEELHAASADDFGDADRLSAGAAEPADPDQPDERESCNGQTE